MWHNNETKERVNWQHPISMQIGWGCGCFGTGCAQWALTERLLGVCVCVFVCIISVYIHMGPLSASALWWKPQWCSRVGVVAASYSLSLDLSALPLRLPAFDQAKAMFARFAASVAISAVRNLACLGGEEILDLYLKQAKDKRSMTQFRPWIAGESSQT